MNEYLIDKFISAVHSSDSDLDASYIPPKTDAPLRNTSNNNVSALEDTLEDTASKNDNLNPSDTPKDAFGNNNLVSKTTTDKDETNSNGTSFGKIGMLMALSVGLGVLFGIKMNK